MFSLIRYTAGAFTVPLRVLSGQKNVIEIFDNQLYEKVFEAIVFTVLKKVMKVSVNVLF